ncbi:uncharacterized protein LOC107367822 isoform X2 [Tetranychus urticae]|uniref:uncharacterized protein LOC107367822 isoform X2 n=1 Tax=Tetranychus urticae TaxID=32264 RepID=UPI00077B8ED4|nr:uncharacterized protein LOC107367822 isoform X2 [Tetranychus urticae]
MFINELPDECLLIIFGSINELDDLVHCYLVCSKWSHLIAERTRKVKYLVEYRWNGDNAPNYTLDYVYYLAEEPLDTTCLSTLFPNLIIADFSGFLSKVKHEAIVTLVKRMKSLKGLINHCCYYEGDESIFQYCDGLEMVSNDHIEPCIKENGVNIKQLHLVRYNLDRFREDAHYFPNLQKLYIYNNEGSPDRYYDGPILEELKIVELSLSSYDGTDIYYGFQFMDSCPNLQSAHIKLDSNSIFVNESLKHKSLQDLVLSFHDRDNTRWGELRRLFLKYPNLKHLAMYSNRSLEDEHIEQLVRILPNLVLFAVRGCPRVTQAAANYVQEYNKLYGRSIKFYSKENYHEIQSDWPQLSTKREKISQGFDFMKHCFLKDFVKLSTFLISSED